jgi:superfamily II DNA or RNA helicase/N-acetylglutamate synthase-like GNAT family acetyltransferase
MATRKRRRNARYSGVNYHNDGLIASDDEPGAFDDEPQDRAAVKKRAAAEYEHPSEMDKGQEYIEKILGRRRTLLFSSRTEYLVKYRSRSYNDVAWVPKEAIKRQDHRVKGMLNRYTRSLHELGYAPNDVVEPPEDGAWFDALYCQVDKVVDIRDKQPARIPPLSQPTHDAIVTGTATPEQRLERCRTVLDNMIEEEDSEVFLEPVREEDAPEYSDIVKTPMDLSTVQNRLTANFYKGSTPWGIFAEDMRLVWANCESYNEQNSPLHQLALQFSARFEALFAQLVLKGDAASSSSSSIGAADGSEIRQQMAAAQAGMAASAAALAQAIGAAPLKMVRSYGKEEKKREYLVKWRGLSYRECTWESKEQINDDQAIKRFLIADRRPSKAQILAAATSAASGARRYPGVPLGGRGVGRPRKGGGLTLTYQEQQQQAAMGNSVVTTLSYRSPPDRIARPPRNAAFGTGVSDGDRARLRYRLTRYSSAQLRAQVRAQILAYYYILRDEAPPPLLLRMTGSPAAVHQWKTASLPAGPVQIPVVQTRPVADAANNGTAGQTALIAADADGDTALAEPVEVPSVVAQVLAEVVEHIACGILRTAQRPPVVEYTVILPKTADGLCMQIGKSSSGHVKVLGFKRKPNNAQGPAEQCGLICVNDIITAVQEDQVLNSSFVEVVYKLRMAPGPLIRLKFNSTRWPWNMNPACNPVIVSEPGPDRPTAGTRPFGSYGAGMLLPPIGSKRRRTNRLVGNVEALGGSAVLGGGDEDGEDDEGMDEVDKQSSKKKPFVAADDDDDYDFSEQEESESDGGSGEEDESDEDAVAHKKAPRGTRKKRGLVAGCAGGSGGSDDGDWGGDVENDDDWQPSTKRGFGDTELLLYAAQVHPGSAAGATSSVQQSLNETAQTAKVRAEVGAIMQLHEPKEITPEDQATDASAQAGSAKLVSTTAGPSAHVLYVEYDGDGAGNEGVGGPIGGGMVPGGLNNGKKNKIGAYAILAKLEKEREKQKLLALAAQASGLVLAGRTSQQPGQPGVPAPPVVPDLELIKTEMIRVYAEHFPENVSKVDLIIKGWVGREHDILPQLYAKYLKPEEIARRAAAAAAAVASAPATAEVTAAAPCTTTTAPATAAAEGTPPGVAASVAAPASPASVPAPVAASVSPVKYAKCGATDMAGGVVEMEVESVVADQKTDDQCTKAKEGGEQGVIEEALTQIIEGVIEEAKKETAQEGGGGSKEGGGSTHGGTEGSEAEEEAEEEEEGDGADSGWGGSREEENAVNEEGNGDGGGYRIPEGEFVPYTKSPKFAANRTLRNYQVTGINWMLNNYYSQRSCILADEMGLGKTMQVTAVLNHLYTREADRGPYLVVAPLSTLQHWRREIETWTKMTVCLYYDMGSVGGATGAMMRAYIREKEWAYRGMPLSTGMCKFHVLITNYETLLADFDVLNTLSWRCLVVDEAQRLKNKQSRLMTYMEQMDVQFRLLLTGTPLQNSTQELWSLLQFIQPEKFHSLDAFNERFGDITTEQQVRDLQRELAPVLLRRKKEDVEKNIPPKEETIIDVELTTLQKRYYRAIFEKNRGYLNKGCKSGNMPKLLNVQMQLRKCCCHPYLIKGVQDREYAGTGAGEAVVQLEGESEAAFRLRTLVAASGKLVLVDKLLPKLQREGHKVLIFSQMVALLDLLDEYLTLRWPETKCFERLDGRVHGNDRQQAIDRFCDKGNDHKFVFLLSTRAGGVGINLTAADTVIIFDSDWNPQNDIQAQARCHRIGQEKAVMIYRLITVKTVEAEIFNRASRKLGLEQAVLGTASERFAGAEDPAGGSAKGLDGGAEKLSTKEMEALIKKGAYSMLDEDDTEANAFVETDIDTILASRSRMVTQKVTTTASALSGIQHGVTKSSFQDTGGDTSLSLDDPDFWEKVLGEELSATSLLIRLTGERASFVSSTEARQNFLVQVEVLIHAMLEQEKNEKSLDHFDTEQQQKRQEETESARRLLLLLSDHDRMKASGFTKQECNQAAKWWMKVDEQQKASATRSCTQKGVNRSWNWGGGDGNDAMAPDQDEDAGEDADDDDEYEDGTSKSKRARASKRSAAGKKNDGEKSTRTKQRNPAAANPAAAAAAARREELYGGGGGRRGRGGGHGLKPADAGHGKGRRRSRNATGSNDYVDFENSEESDGDLYIVGKDGVARERPQRPLHARGARTLRRPAITSFTAATGECFRLGDTVLLQSGEANPLVAIIQSIYTIKAATAEEAESPSVVVAAKEDEAQESGQEQQSAGDASPEGAVKGADAGGADGDSLAAVMSECPACAEEKRTKKRAHKPHSRKLGCRLHGATPTAPPRSPASAATTAGATAATTAGGTAGATGGSFVLPSSSALQQLRLEVFWLYRPHEVELEGGRMGGKPPAEVGSSSRSAATPTQLLYMTFHTDKDVPASSVMCHCNCFFRSAFNSPTVDRLMQLENQQQEQQPEHQEEEKQEERVSVKSGCGSGCSGEYARDASQVVAWKQQQHRKSKQQLVLVLHKSKAGGTTSVKAAEGGKGGGLGEGLLPPPGLTSHPLLVAGTATSFLIEHVYDHGKRKLFALDDRDYRDTMRQVLNVQLARTDRMIANLAVMHTAMQQATQQEALLDAAAADSTGGAGDAGAGSTAIVYIPPRVTSYVGGMAAGLVHPRPSVGQQLMVWRKNPAYVAAYVAKAEGTEGGNEDTQQDAAAKEEAATAKEEKVAATEEAPVVKKEAPVVKEEEAAVKVGEGVVTASIAELSFSVVGNEVESSPQRSALRDIFAEQLPKMPKDYITGLINDGNHQSLVAFKGGAVIGGICFLPHISQQFAEIVFCAITADEQVKGYGTQAMKQLKEHAKKKSMTHFLTYADNYAIGYFSKQGFSTKLSMDRRRWFGYIKDYDGGTLMEFSLHQDINYLTAVTPASSHVVHSHATNGQDAAEEGWYGAYVADYNYMTKEHQLVYDRPAGVVLQQGETRQSHNLSRIFLVGEWVVLRDRVSSQLNHKTDKGRTGARQKRGRAGSSGDDDAEEGLPWRRKTAADTWIAKHPHVIAPPPAIGSRLEVLWGDDGVYYAGVVVGYDGATGEHRLEYDEGTAESLKLYHPPKEKAEESTGADAMVVDAAADGAAGVAGAATDVAAGGEKANAEKAAPTTPEEAGESDQEDLGVLPADPSAATDKPTEGQAADKTGVGGAVDTKGGAELSNGGQKVEQKGEQEEKQGVDVSGKDKGTEKEAGAKYTFTVSAPEKSSSFEKISDDEDEEEDEMLLDLEESASATKEVERVKWRLIETGDDEDEDDERAELAQYGLSEAAAKEYTQQHAPKKNQKRKRPNGGMNEHSNSNGGGTVGRNGSRAGGGKERNAGKDRRRVVAVVKEPQRYADSADEEPVVSEPSEPEDRYDSDGGIVVTRPRKRKAPARLQVDGTPDRPRRHAAVQREPQRLSRRERMANRGRGAYIDGEDEEMDEDEDEYKRSNASTGGGGKRGKGGRGKSGGARSATPEEVGRATPVEERAWAQCGKCEKWRQLAWGAETWEGEFFCEMNSWDVMYNSCDKQEDPTANDTGGEDSAGDAHYAQAVALSLNQAQHGAGGGARQPSPRPSIPAPAIGETIEVLWPEDQQYYLAEVESYNPRTGEHTIEYATGDVEDLDLSRGNRKGGDGGGNGLPQHDLLKGLLEAASPMQILDRANSLTQWRSVKPAPKKKGGCKGSKKGRNHNRNHTPRPSSSDQSPRAGEKAEKFDPPAPLAGQRLEIVWPANGQWYSGVVDRFDRPTGRHLIVYDEGSEEMVDFGYIHLATRRLGRKDKKRMKGQTKAIWEGVWDGDEGEDGMGEASAMVGGAVSAEARAKAIANRAADGGDRGAIAACAGARSSDDCVHVLLLLT